MTCKKARKTISIVLSILFMVTMLPTTHVSANYSGCCGIGAHYSFDKSSSTLTITGNGGKVLSPKWSSFKDDIQFVVIEDGVTSICQSLFDGHKNLTCVSIPESVTEIGKDAFINCASLISIKVNRANISYKTINGILFSKDGSKLIKYPEGKKENRYIIPSSVTEIVENAFLNCLNLTSKINIDNVTSIGYHAFDGCPGSPLS